MTIYDIDFDLAEITEARRVLQVDGWSDPELNCRVDDLLDARTALTMGARVSPDRCRRRCHDVPMTGSLTYKGATSSITLDRDAGEVRITHGARPGKNRTPHATTTIPLSTITGVTLQGGFTQHVVVTVTGQPDTDDAKLNPLAVQTGIRKVAPFINEVLAAIGGKPLPVAVPKKRSAFWSAFDTPGNSGW